jgi:AraC family transcriptional regulator
MPLMKTIPNSLPVHECYGVCFYTGSFAQIGLFYYLAGIPLPSIEEIPIAMVGKTLPASEYAVFTHKGPIVSKTGTIRDTYTYAYGTWLPNSPYVNPYAYDFEFYDERYKADSHNCLEDAESEMDVCIPIRKR